MNKLMDMILKEADDKCAMIKSSSKDSVTSLLKKSKDKTEKVLEQLDEDKILSIKSIDRELENSKRSIYKRYSSAQRQRIERELFKVFDIEMEKFCCSKDFEKVLINWAIESVSSLQKDDVELYTKPILSSEAIKIVKEKSSEIVGYEINISCGKSNLSDYGCVTNSKDGYVSYSNLVKDRKRRFRKEISKIIEIAIQKSEVL